MRRVALGLIAAFALCLPAAHADDAAHLALARDVIAAMHTADQMRLALPAMAKQARPVLFVQAGGDDKGIDDFLARYDSNADALITQVTDKIAEIYAQNLTDADLKGLLAFYKSPAGLDFIGKENVITAATQQLGVQWGQAYMRDAVQKYKAERGVN
jgi:hypothetical protein